MSKWLRISNPGCFDVVSAVNMLGASVKVGTNPIGMFGSGTKFALAQAVRSKCDVKIYDGERMFNVGSALKEFRDRSFGMVALNAVGKRVVTPITTDFGSKDWNEDWFIFREFYANALDEGNAKLDIVDKAEPTPNSTSVFLPYERFRTFQENLKQYFTDLPRYTFRVGDGSVYKQGVFVGKMEGTTIDFHCPMVKINECRVMDSYDASMYYASYMSCCVSSEIWTAFFQSSDMFKLRMNMAISGAQTYDAMHKALLNVYGDKYCICPNVDSIIRDAQAMGLVPVVIHDGIQMDSDKLRMYLKMNDTKVVRKMNESEQEKYNIIRKKISAFIPESIEIDVKVFSEGLEGVLGDAKFGSAEIRIRDTMFQDEAKLMHVIIHEIGHIITKAGDYDRRFCAFFVDKLVELSQ